MTDKERKELISRASIAVNSKYKRTFESLQSLVEETELFQSIVMQQTLPIIREIDKLYYEMMFHLNIDFVDATDRVRLEFDPVAGVHKSYVDDRLALEVTINSTPNEIKLEKKEYYKEDNFLGKH